VNRDRDQQSKDKAHCEQAENARVGYEAAIQMWYYYGEVLWQKYNALLVANSIVIAAIGFVSIGQDTFSALSLILPVLGLILCATWFLIAVRGVAYHMYFMHSAREIEEEYLANEVKSLARGKLYGDGKWIKLRLGGEPKCCHQMSRWARLAKTRTLSYIVILMFALIYLVFLASSLNVFWQLHRLLATTCRA